MSSISSTLQAAASALDTFQYALTVSQNNIGNSSTPGYAKQIVAFQAEPFDPSAGVTGGVTHGIPTDSRDLIAENDVWQQSGAQGDATARNQALGIVQNALPVSDGSGIPAALTTFFNDVSAWSASPTSSSARQTVMIAADSLARSFNTTAAAVAQVSQSVSQNINSTVDQINHLTTQVASLNAGIMGGGQHDAGLQAQLYSTLETLSGLVNISVLPHTGGAVDVTLSGGAALVLGSQSFALTPGLSAAPGPVSDAQGPADVAIRGADGSNVNSQISSGALAGLLQVRNVTIPGLIGDTSQPGALNQLASTLSSRVNQIISQGSVSTGVPAPSGLFTVDPTHPASAAASLAVDPKMSASLLPAIDQNGVSNGVPLALAALANPQQTADKIDSLSYTTFYGNTAAQVGTEVNQAQSDVSLYNQSLAQAQSMRQAQSGVSLDAEAINILQLQAGYQAVAKLITTLANMTQALISMIPA